MGNYLTSTGLAEKTVHVKQIRRSINHKGRPNVKLGDLPEDVLCTILSKLPTKEAAQTSILSSEWRFMWTTCPKLSFSSVDDMHRRGRKQHTQRFIDRVNAVLLKHCGQFVDGLEIKFIFESKLVCHLNNWIRSAMSSRTKTLALDLAPPSNFKGHGDRFIFPFELLDKESSLEHLQLSFVCFRLPPSNSHLMVGLQNLRMLYLHVLNTTRQDLEDVLCNCCNLEWLSLLRCNLYDELKVVRRPLAHLQYLQVVYCEITKIELHAANLSTFVYNGDCIPIALHESSKLENANLSFLGSTFQHAAAAVLNGLPDVQNLTLNFFIQTIETTWELHSRHMFSKLRHVQIMLAVSHEDDDKILYLVSLLRVTPFIENLEVHLDGVYTLWFATSGPSRYDIPPCEYKYLNLKNVHVTGFRAARGQIEFLAHLAENAPAIETLTVDTSERLADMLDPQEINPALSSAALNIIKGPLCKRLPPDAKLFLL